MIWYFVGRGTDDKGNEIPDVHSVYAYTLDESVATRVLDMFRSAQDETRQTYAPGTIKAPNDQAWVREQAQRAATVKEVCEATESENSSKLGKLINLVDFMPRKK